MSRQLSPFNKTPAPVQPVQPVQEDTDIIDVTASLTGATPNIEEPRRIIRQGLLVILLFFGAFGVWSVLGHITGAVVGSGTVKIESERKTVQHLEGGIVDAILVSEGNTVTAGQTLIVLKSIQVDASVDMYRKSLMTNLAMLARFQAEKELADTIDWGNELPGLVQKYNGESILSGELKIFEARHNSYQSQLYLLKAQITQMQSQIAGLQEQLQAETSIIGTLDEELKAKRQLVAERYLERSQVLELERLLASHKGNRGSFQQQIAEAKQKIAELELRSEDVKTRFVEEAASQIGTLENQIRQTREQLRPVQDAQHRLNVIAPVSGRIVGLQVHSLGGVVRPGDPLMDIVPDDSPLVVEIHIPVDKVADVFVGQEAQLQLDAFDRRTTPLIKGKVAYVGADRQEDQTSMGAVPYYMCHVEVAAQAVKDAGIYLSPGMPATVFITTKERTILGYMLEPLLKSWDRALRD